MTKYAHNSRSSLEQLERYVSDGKIKIINIHTVPRAISAALGRALNESADQSVYVHEPFHRVGQDIEEAASHVLHAAGPLLATSQRQVTVITKSYARHLLGDNFTRWTALCAAMVYLVRDPRVQIGSFLVRFANDLCIEPGADVLSQSQLRGDYLKTSALFIKGGSLQDFSRTSWLEIGEHFKATARPKRFTIVDGAELTNSPESVLRGVCAELGLTFRYRMINGWKNNVVNANTRRWNKQNTSLDHSLYNGWIGRAMYSTGLAPTKRSPFELSDLPVDLRHHITDVAVPIYKEIIANKSYKVGVNSLLWPQRPAYRKEQPIEIIEHKAEGHPDSICDILSSATIDAYTTMLGRQVGGVPNGSFDKVAIAGGEAELGFGYSRVVKPPTIYLFGKAMSINGSNQYMEPLFHKVAGSVIHDIFGRSLTGEGARRADINIVVNVNSGIGAEHHPSFYTTKSSVTDLWDYRLSNDTVACAGWYPFTRHERLTVELANYINGPGFKSEFPDTGTDVKVLVHRRAESTYVTLCVPFIAELTPSAAYYEERKAMILQKVTTFVMERVGSSVTVKLNTKDIPGTGYLTVFGTAFDKGDNGMTGRGNRFPGMISITRPSGVEAFSGKNPFNHTGRIYTAFAFELAKLIYTTSGYKTTTFVTALNGDPLGVPDSITVMQGGLDVTVLYGQQIDRALHLLPRAGSSQGQSALQLFRSCYGYINYGN